MVITRASTSLRSSSWISRSTVEPGDPVRNRKPQGPGRLRAAGDRFRPRPFDDLEAINKVAESNPNVVAVLLEPIQGEGGVHVAHADYLRAVRELCTRHGWLMMLDEVQCGIGRTGAWFAHQQVGIRPDVMSLAKGLGSGVPIGACLAAGPAVDVFKPGNHGSTFGGNPLACAAGLATLEVLEDEGLLERAAKVGDHIRRGFAAAFEGLSGVRDIRGQGLMIGIELDRPCGELVGRALPRAC